MNTNSILSLLLQIRVQPTLIELPAVYGEDGQKKTKMCQWHYLHKAAHHSKQLPTENRDSFMKLVQDLCMVSTVSLYTEKLEEMVCLCENNDQVKNWIN